jgi:hypothetical protein
VLPRRGRPEGPVVAGDVLLEGLIQLAITFLVLIGETADGMPSSWTTVASIESSVLETMKVCPSGSVSVPASWSSFTRTANVSRAARGSASLPAASRAASSMRSVHVLGSEGSAQS